MRTKSGQMVYGVSYADTGDRQHSRVSAGCTPGTLAASGGSIGSPLDPEDLDESSLAEYHAWRASQSVTAIRVMPTYDRFTASLVRQAGMPEAVGYEGPTEDQAVARLRRVYDRLPAGIPLLRVNRDGTPR